MFGLVADLVVVVHVLFVVFAVAGGLLALKWHWVAVLHLPAALYAVLIEFFGWICPLTPLEIWLRQQAEEPAYSGTFIEHYVMPILYPPGLTRNVQYTLGFAVLVINLAIYGWLVWKHTKHETRP